jgi:hypothetical protein
MPPPYRRYHPRHQHLELARGPELPGEPFQLILERGRLRILQDIGEQGDGRAQPPQSDPHLVHAFGIACEQGGLVANHLLKAGKPDGLETVAGGCSEREIDRDGFHRRVVVTCEHLVPAFRLALECNLSRKRLGELACDLEQIGLVAALELELDLAQRPGVAAGCDLSLVQRQCDLAGSIAERIGRPPHPRLEHRLELPTKLIAQQRLKRGASRQTQVKGCPLNFAFPFIAAEWPEVPGRFDRLDVAVAAAAHPQHHAFLAELVLVGIEIDRDLSHAFGAPLLPAE